MAGQGSKPPVSFSDEQQRSCVQSAAAGVVEQLKRAVVSNPDRMIRQLVPIEAENIASAAIAGWVKKRAEIAEAGGDLLDAVLREMDMATVLNDSLEDMLG